MPTLNSSQDVPQTIVLPDGSIFKPVTVPIIPGVIPDLDTTSKEEVVLGYQYNGQDISELVSLYNTNMKSELSSSFGNKHYVRSDGVDIDFISYPIAHKYLDGIWGEKLTLGYKYEGNNVEFVSRGSTPYPIVTLSGNIPFNVNRTVLSDTYVWYDSSTGYIKYSATSTTSGSNLFKAHGIYIALQGGGGGGGEGSCLNLGISSGCRGGGGGGGGGFILLYVNLKTLGQPIYLHPGVAGAYGGGSGDHVRTDRGDNGVTGGSSTLHVKSGSNWKVVASAYGGVGGKGADNGPTEESKGKGWGGSGGGTFVSSNSNISIIARYNGKDGGNGGNFSGYTAGIPYGTQKGNGGNSFSNSDIISVPILASSGSIYRSYDSKICGGGQSANNNGTDGYTSGGGGGGGSVAGRTDGISRDGYGVGGYGGPAESATVHQSQSGTRGAIFILHQIN